MSLAALTVASEDGGLSPRDSPVIAGSMVARLLAFAEATYPTWASWLQDEEAALRQLRGTRDLLSTLSVSQESTASSDVEVALEALEELITVLRAKLEASRYSDDKLAQRYTITIPAVPGAPRGPRRGAA